MGRPETISCKRCNASVAVKARGPVPSFCATCRKTSRRPATTRPAHVACQLCGAQVVVKPRGPLPKSCRGGCSAETVSATPVNVPEQPAVKRPWDWEGQPAATAIPTMAPVREPALAPNGHTPAPAFEGGAVTRIDRTHPVTVVATQDLGRRVRAQQLRHAAAIGLWLTVIAVIALVVYIGSQPSAPNF